MASTAVPVGPALGLLPPELKSLIVEFVALVDEEGDFEDDDEDGDEDDEDEEHDCSKHAPGEHHHGGGGHKHSHGEEGEDHEHSGDCCKVPLPAMVALSLVNREFAELAYPYIYKVS